MMASASLSAAASAAVSTSSTALGVAVTRAVRPPLWLAIQSAFRYVLYDAVRYQVPDGFPGLYPGAALGGRNGQRRDLHQAYLAVRQALVGEQVTWPGTAYEMCQAEQFVRIVPGQDLGQGIGAGDEVELVSRLGLSPQVLQSVDRVGRARTVDIYPAHAEPRVGGSSDHRHQIPVLGCGNYASLLLVRLAGRDEDNLI